jgi:hypothetical protein
MSKQSIDDVLQQQVGRLLKAWREGGESIDENGDTRAEAVFRTFRIIAPVVNMIGDVLPFEVEGIESDRRVVVVGNMIAGDEDVICGSIIDPVDRTMLLLGFYADLLITSDDLFLLHRKESGAHKAWKLRSPQHLKGFCTNVNYPKMVTTLSHMMAKATKGHLKKNKKRHRKAELIRQAMEAANEVLGGPEYEDRFHIFLVRGDKSYYWKDNYFPVNDDTLYAILGDVADETDFSKQHIVIQDTIGVVLGTIRSRDEAMEFALPSD